MFRLNSALLARSLPYQSRALPMGRIAATATPRFLVPTSRTLITSRPAFNEPTDKTPIESAAEPSTPKAPVAASKDEPTVAELAGKGENLWHGDHTRKAGTSPMIEMLTIPTPSQRDMGNISVVFQEDELLWSESMGISMKQFQRLKKRVLHVRRTSNMTRKGKMPSMYALVVVGNGEGAAGYGEAKSEEVADAVRKATVRAIKAMEFIPRYDNRTIFHDIKHKFKATHIDLFARPPGFGKRVNPYLYEICYCAGIEDIAGKVNGSRNPMNVIKGMFEALQTQRTPGEIAMARGKKLVDVHHVYYGGMP